MNITDTPLPFPSNDRASIFLNFARLNSFSNELAYDIAASSIDDASDLDDSLNSTLTMLAYTLYRSDSDFDYFLHELRHTLNICDDDDYCADDDD